MSMVSGPSSPARDRKKSAHWTDNDTESLVNVLLRYKDSGRTPDNGFRPEVWKEASLVLERSTFIGGPKTPEACKSRWQRIQRDFRAAKEIEEMPGFRWDRQEGRLIASPEAWKAAEAQLAPYKYSRIHLTCYDSLAILCPDEPIRSRQRAKGRSSHGTSDTSSMISLSVTGSSHLDDLPQQNYQAHHNGALPMGEIQSQMGGGMMWETAGDEDGEGEYEPFAIQDSNHSFMSQKRMPFDPSIMNSQSGHPIVQQNVQSNQASPPKKPRLASTRPPPQLHAQHAQLYAMTMPRSPTYNTGPQQTLLDPAVLTPSHPQQRSQHHQLSHPIHITHPPPHAPDGPPPHLLVNQTHTPQSGSDPNSTSSNNNNNNGIATPNSNTIPNMTPAQSQQMHRPTNPTPNSMQHQNMHSQHHNPHPQHPPSHQQQQQMPTPSHTLPSNPHTPVNGPDTYMNSPAPTPSLAAEVQYAGLSDSQRRTQAILQLQQELEMRDEDMVEVMAEFENNIAAADTYLAIKKDQLRRMYLRTIVQRRRQNG